MLSADDIFYISGLLFLALILVVWLAHPREKAAPPAGGCQQRARIDSIGGNCFPAISADNATRPPAKKRGFLPAAPRCGACGASAWRAP